jgi:signal transduction histidine kinase
MADFMELAATAIANAQAVQELRELAGTQAALRRLATLVARGEPPEAVFAAATREALRHVGGATARMIRYEPDGTATLVANEGTAGPPVRVGERWEGYPPTGLTATVLRTGQAARVDDYRDIPGGEPYLREGLRSAVAVPIHVDGRLWGMIAVGSGEGPLPPEAEQRMTEFTRLVATAVANAQNRAALEASRDELARLADEQAALRRVATLVALGGAPAELFAAVTGEAGQLLGAHLAGMARYESDHTVTVLATWATEDEQHPLVPGPWPLDGGDLASAVFETGRPVRIDDYRGIPGHIAAFVRDELGISSSIASPVVVEGRLWGVLFLHSKQASRPFPPDTESRLTGFTELAATAIANTESRAELAASRTRIVAAADEARRRIERNLHDGAQQHLVALALKLRSAAVADNSDEIRTEITEVATRLTGVIDELREISHGIHPAILSRAGLRSALRALGRRSPVPVDLDVRIEDRLPEPVEVAAYYVVSEMLTNAAKHARASIVEVDAETSGGTLRVSVRDDGAGGADPARGSGLTGLKDRIEALGGTFSLHSPASAGTTVSCELPVLAGGGHPDAERDRYPMAGGRGG